MAIFGVGFVLPGIPAPSPRGLAEFLGTDAAEGFFRGAWGWLAVIFVFAVFNTVLGEELLFRGLLLPRMRGVFGRYDWVANGVLFACYHLHTPWVIPTALINVFAISYPSRRYESAWMGILVHSTQSVGLIAIVLALVVS
jgi:membrane protease YdiL (CAAX protease family)